MLEDLKRSGPIRVGLGYALTGGALLIVAEIVFAAIGAPPWVMRLMVAAIIMAFPFVVVLTWALSAGPPEGQPVRPRPWET